MTAAVPRVALAPGYSIARVVNGCWQLSGGHGAERTDRRALIDDLLRLVDAGFTTFDVADIYTGVERLLGEVLATHRKRGGDPKIEVHTKLVPDRSTLPTLRRRDVEASVHRSLRRLGVERLDLVQFHWWDYAVDGWLDVVDWLGRLQETGKIRHLGLTNFDTDHVAAIVASGAPIVSHQVQYSLLDRRPARRMVDTCGRAGVGLVTYGALAGGFLSRRWHGLPAPSATRPPLANRSLVKYRLIIEECGGWHRFQRLLDALAVVADRHAVEPSAVAARWVLERPGVSAVLVGTRDADRLEARLGWLSFPFDEEDDTRLGRALVDLAPPPGDVFEIEREADGAHAAIMKTELNRADSAPER